MAIADAQQRLQEAINAYSPVAQAAMQARSAPRKVGALPDYMLTSSRSGPMPFGGLNPEVNSGLLAAIDPQINAYNDVYNAYLSLAEQVAAQYPPGTDEKIISQDPRIKAAFDQVSPLYNEGAMEGLRDASGQMVKPPPFNTGNGSSGLTSALKMALPAALSFFGTPALGGALGSVLGSASLGSALAGAGIGGLTSAVTGSNPLMGALTGGAGGYLGGGGWGDLGLPSLPDISLPDIGLGDIFGSSPDAARVATGGTGSSGLPSAGGVASGGGTGGGFFTSLGDSVLGPDFYNSLSSSSGGIGSQLSAPGLTGAISPAATAAGVAATPSFFSDPLAYLGGQIEKGISDTLSPASLLSKGVKGGLSYALQKDNDAGFNALQGAATRTAENYQPWVASGQSAQRMISDLNGLGGADARAAALAGFQADPGYQFGLNEGIKALDASAAKRGMLMSGNNQQAVQQYGTGLAQNYFDKYYGRLADQANKGYQAVGSMGDYDIGAQSVYAAKKKSKADDFNTFLNSIFG